MLHHQHRQQSITNQFADEYLQQKSAEMDAVQSASQTEMTLM
jgi:hypothetical protein